jgi:hypothetical protein
MRVQVALLFLATDGDLPHEAAWRSWLQSAEGLLPVAQISQVCTVVLWQTLITVPWWVVILLILRHSDVQCARCKALSCSGCRGQV